MISNECFEGLRKDLTAMTPMLRELFTMTCSPTFSFSFINNDLAIPEFHFVLIERSFAFTYNVLEVYVDEESAAFIKFGEDGIVSVLSVLEQRAVDEQTEFIEIVSTPFIKVRKRVRI